MSFRAIKQHIHLDKNYTDAQEDIIWDAIKHAYKHSDTAQAMLDTLGTTHNDITIHKENDFYAIRGGDDLYIGTRYLDNITMIDSHGMAVQPNFETSLMHEFSHAINNVSDPTDDQILAHNYVGDNLFYENAIRSELGFGPRLGYFNAMQDSVYDALPPAYSDGYSNGEALDMIVFTPVRKHNVYDDIDTTSLGSSSDLLMDIRNAANNFLSGDGDDFLYGWGGKDTLDGGAGNDAIFGGDKSDLLIAGTGNDFVDGGAGKDIAELTGFKYMHSITTGSDTVITDLGTGEFDTLRNVELYRFDGRYTPLPSDITSSFVSGADFTLEPNDDGSADASLTQAFEGGLNFFGTKYTDVYVNNNGNLTFGAGLSSYTPGSIGGDSGLPIIAAFWADADTRNGGGTVSYGYNAAHDSFVATWSNVDYFSAYGTDHITKSNSYQIEIIDQGAGDAEIIIRYGSLSWTTGDYSGGTDGLGGTPARAGINSGNATFQFELPGSGDQDSMLSLGSTTNCGRDGVWAFSVHNGLVLEDDTSSLAAAAHSAHAADWQFA